MAQRIWLDWSAPALPQAARWLVRAGDAGGAVCDLQDTLIVVPGARAGRLLLHALVSASRQSGLHLVPPRIVTPAPMVDLLVRHATVTASPTESVLAWLVSLRESDPAELAPLLPSTPDDPAAWLDVAALLAGVHDELAGQRKDAAAAAEAVEQLHAPGEVERWHAFGRAAQRYRRRLHDCGLEDAQVCRQEAIDAERTETIDHVVLTGVVELNRLQRDTLALHEERVSALVHAPEKLAGRFDELGRIDAGAWADEHVELPDEAIIVADRPEDQAQAVVRAIAALDGQYSAEEIVVGLADQTLAGAVVRAGRWADLPMRSAAGRPFTHTGPGRFLDAAVDAAEQKRFRSLATLARHPDVEAWLLDREKEMTGELFGHPWPSLLDRYASKHLPARLDERWRGKPHRAEQLARLGAMIGELLEPLDDSRRPLGQWAERALAMLERLYGDLAADSGDERVEACLALRGLLVALARAHGPLQPTLGGTEALRVILRQAQHLAVPAEAEVGSIELLGWLELHLDPAPVHIVAGVNDGALPQVLAADPLLPDGLRRKLGLASNRTRSGRDAYLLRAAAACRSHLLVVAGRTSEDGDLLTPSRLLLARPREELPGRIAQLCGKDAALAWSVPLGAPEPREASAFDVPALPRLSPVEAMAVTSFRDYLQCPYRFALARLLRLEALIDDAPEMDALHFGILAHAVLHEFGNDPVIRDSTDRERIATWLAERLAGLAQELYGSRPFPAVGVQIARLRRRLEGFARFQAEHRRRGWTIRHCEIDLPPDARLALDDGSSMRLKGRIDRIDHHAESGRWLIIDYKTGEGGDTPAKTHRRNKQWVDVQLPLYGHFAALLGLGSPVGLAYIVLPRDPDDVAMHVAGWTDPELAEALATAKDVARRVRAGAFELNRDHASSFDPFARICQTYAFVADDEEGGPE